MQSAHLKTGNRQIIPSHPHHPSLRHLRHHLRRHLRRLLLIFIHGTAPFLFLLYQEQVKYKHKMILSSVTLLLKGLSETTRYTQASYLLKVAYLIGIKEVSGGDLSQYQGILALEPSSRLQLL